MAHDAAETEPEGLLCPVEFAEALKDCFHEADKQLLHWLKSRSTAGSIVSGTILYQQAFLMHHIFVLCTRCCVQLCECVTNFLSLPAVA